MLLRWLGYLLLTLLLFWGAGLLLWRFVLPPATPLMVIRAVEQGAWVDYRPVRLEQMAASLPRTVIVAEDGRFCLHNGLDLAAVEEAIQDFRERGRLRGASTITMQVARNLFLWNGGGAVRKALELPLALALDALWPKERILEVYLNIAEWGDGVFGAEAAARKHFGKAAAHLTAAQSARLAAVLPSPRRWNAAQPGPYVAQRTQTLLRRAGQLNRHQTACWSH
jgi:monofunctional biosynthetic peptidoglycan transglycosylase